MIFKISHRVGVRLLFFAAVLLVVSGAWWLNQKESTATHQSSQLTGIEQGKSRSFQPIKIAVLPHHNILLPEFNQWYQQLASSRSAPVTTIILISPNHFQPYQKQVITDDEDVLKNEHGVQLHVPYLKQYFPQAKVMPFLVTRNLPSNAVEELKQFVASSLADPTTLVVASVDFSHYLPTAQASLNDQQINTMVGLGQSQAILGLGDEYLDCPVCLYLVLEGAKEYSLQGPELIFHSNSAEYLQLGDQAPTTSYFVWWWRQP